MGIFGRGKSNNAAPAAPQAEVKKKSGELSKVLSESVWESAHEDLKANTQFIINDNGKVEYVALLVDTAQFGGLAGREARKDESKGSIIEAIKTGRIKTYLTREMLLDDSILIIPTPDTIENMGEFVLFVDNTQYVLCVVDQQGMIRTMTVNGTDAEDDPEATVTYDQVKGVIDEQGDVHSIFPSARPLMSSSDNNNDEDAIPEDEDEEPAKPARASVQNEVPEMPIPPADDPDDAETLDDVPMDPDEEDDMDYDESAGEYNGVDAGYMSNSDTPTDWQDGNNQADADVGGYNAYPNVTPEVVTTFVKQKYYSDSLGLEISTDPFDARFLSTNTIVPFSENRGPGKLNEYLSNLSRDANTRLEAMHVQNLQTMRESYMNLLQKHCKNIAEKLNVANTSTTFGKMADAIEQNRRDNIENIQDNVADKKAENEAKYQERMNQATEAAAANARISFEERYGAQHEADLLRIEEREKDEIERDYDNAMKKLNSDRRDEAQSLLDAAIVEVMEEMTVMYAALVDRETAERARIQKEIMRFIDANRKDEKARVEALAEENRQSKKAAEVRDSLTAKIKSMSIDFDMKKAALQADIDRMHREQEEELRNCESRWSERYNTEKAHAENLETQIADLLKQYSELDEKKSAEYESKFNSLKEEAEAKDEHVKKILSSAKRTNMISIAIVIVGIIVSIAIGFFLGSNSNKTAGNVPADNTSKATFRNIDDDAGYNTGSNFTELDIG